MEKIKIVAVVGPTASGKTSLCVRLAQRFNGEIVSADSMQIYKGMPVASAVPSEEEQQGIVHHFIEILEPVRRFTVADYVSMAHGVIADIDARGKLPIITGGTGLYVDSLLNNLRFTEEKEDSDIRAALISQAEQNGIETLHERLASIDPQSAEHIHPNDRKRIIRALEIYELTGMTATEQKRISRLEKSPYDYMIIGLRFIDRQILYDRINRRVDAMLENGLLDEARISFERSSQYPTACAAIGHKELFGYFSGEITLQQAVENLKQATRRYAKRQMTWFRKNENIHWIDVDAVDDVFKVAADMIEQF